MIYIQFLHIPKTGGSSFKYAFRQDRLITDYPLTNYSVDEEYSLTLNGHGQTGGNGMKMVFMVRDPIERFVSGFKGRFNKDKPLYRSHWLEEEKKAFTWFQTSNRLAEALSNADKKEKAEFAMNNIMYISGSYWDYFHDEDFVKRNAEYMLWVGRTKYLNEDFEVLKKLLKVSNKVQLPTDMLNKHKCPYPDEPLSEMAKDNLRKWYKKDYRFLELIKEYKGVEV